MMTDPTGDALKAWETFRDPAYYDMHCVRQVGQRTFGQGFHLVNGDEAQSLTDMLNARTPPVSIDEVEWLRSALIEVGRVAGSFLKDDVSTDFLMHIPNEVRACITRATMSVQSDKGEG